MSAPSRVLIGRAKEKWCREMPLAFEIPALFYWRNFLASATPTLHPWQTGKCHHSFFPFLHAQMFTVFLLVLVSFWISEQKSARNTLTPERMLKNTRMMRCTFAGWAPNHALNDPRAEQNGKANIFGSQRKSLLFPRLIRTSVTWERRKCFSPMRFRVNSSKRSIYQKKTINKLIDDNGTPITTLDTFTTFK